MAFFRFQLGTMVFLHIVTFWILNDVNKRLINKLNYFCLHSQLALLAFPHHTIFAKSLPLFQFIIQRKWFLPWRHKPITIVGRIFALFLTNTVQTSKQLFGHLILSRFMQTIEIMWNYRCEELSKAQKQNVDTNFVELW